MTPADWEWAVWALFFLVLGVGAGLISRSRKREVPRERDNDFDS